MGIRINQNIASLQAQNAMQKTSKKLATSLERLSTGLRINRGADDPTGLAKSESIRSQVRGIGVAKVNISTGSSLLNTAEGFLGEMTTLAQQMREVALQAIDGSVTTSDRTNLTNKLSSLQSEYSRLAAAAKFAGVALLDGTFANKSIHAGPDQGDSLTFSITDSRATAIGQIALLTSVTVATVTLTALQTMGDLDHSNVIVDGVTVTTSVFSSDGVSNTEGDESAIAYVNAINSVSGASGVSAVANANIVTMASFTGTGTKFIDAAHTLLINGVRVAQADYAATLVGANSLVAAITAISTQTGVTATIDGSASAIVLTAEDGRNIDIVYNTSAGGFDNVTAGSVKDIMGLFGNNASISADGSGLLSAATISRLIRGTFRLFSDAAFTLDDGTANGISTQSTIVVGTTALDDISITTSSTARDAVFRLDQVISQLQSRRASVGTNSLRLDTALSELRSREENLSAAESVIRDTDIASETANLTSFQILQQAGAAVLQRANALPQLALQLLQG